MQADASETSGLISGRDKKIACGITGLKVFIALAASAGFFVIGLWGITHYHDSSSQKVDQDESSQNSSSVNAAAALGFPFAYIAFVCAMESVVNKLTKETRLYRPWYLYRPWHVTNILFTTVAAAYVLYRMYETHFVSAGEARQSDDSYVPGAWLLTALIFGIRSACCKLPPACYQPNANNAVSLRETNYGDRQIRLLFDQDNKPCGALRDISAYVAPEDEEHFRRTYARAHAGK